MKKIEKSSFDVLVNVYVIYIILLIGILIGALLASWKGC
jgi:hypothetical protein